MTLLFPLGLAALAGLLVPLILHLARRTEQRPTDFAALRWLRQKPRPRHRPRFDEWLLLAVRLLLIAALALVIARPVATGKERAEAVIAVAPGAKVLAPGAARRVWLAPGFPAIVAGDAPPAAGPTASLIRQLDATLPASAALTLVVPRVLDGADAERPRVSRAARWVIAGEGRAPAAGRPGPLPLLQADPMQPGARYIAAALRALSPPSSLPPSSQRKLGSSATGDSPSAKDPSLRWDDGRGGGARPVIWLGAGAIPVDLLARVQAGTTLLVGQQAVVPAATANAVWRDDAGATLVEAQPLGRGRLLRFTRPLVPAAMPQVLEPDFPRRLAALFAAAEPAPARVLAAAYQPQPGAVPPVPPARPLWPPFALAAVGLFVAERWLATRRARGIAP
ncbi:MAG: BatA domain-containing protein [Sphingomonas taxi]